MMGFYLMLGFYFDLFSMPVKSMCVSSRFGIRQVIIVCCFVIIGSMNRIGPLVFANSCETQYTSYLSQTNLIIYRMFA